MNNPTSLGNSFFFTYTNQPINQFPRPFRPPRTKHVSCFDTADWIDPTLPDRVPFTLANSPLRCSRLRLLKRVKIAKVQQKIASAGIPKLNLRYPGQYSALTQSALRAVSTNASSAPSAFSASSASIAIENTSHTVSNKLFNNLYIPSFGV